MDNYFTKERDEWLATRKGKFTSSEIYKLFISGTRDMTDAELAARPKYIKKNGEEGAFIGGTKVSVLFGDGAISYIRSRLDELLSISKTPEETSSTSEYKQLAWGTDNEGDAIRHFKVITGYSIIHYGGLTPKFFHYGDFSGGSPDGEVLGESAIVEVKCPFDTKIQTKRLLYKSVQDFKDNEWDTYCQCQMNMYIMGRDHSYFCSYDPRKVHKHLQMKIIKFQADSEWQIEFEKRLEAAIEMMREMLSDVEKYLRIGL